jgi:murein DD-endopeptidase MepM/ murein hydrolase activator NlpD
MARYPVDDIRVMSPYGERTVTQKIEKTLTTTSQGHWGIDLGGTYATPVKAPEDGTVVNVFSSPLPNRDDNTTLDDQGWTGYGPGGVEIHGASGMYHLIAHVDPMVTLGQQVSEGDQVGVMVSHVGVAAPHVHWEARATAVDSKDTREADTVDPAIWFKLVSSGAWPGPGNAPRGRQGVPWWVWLGVLFLWSRI